MASPTFVVTQALRAGLLFRTKQRGYLLCSLHRLWAVFLPVRAAGGAPRQPDSATMVPRLQRLWGGLLRGLGGLCRLKLRYKGKSFKWHHRRGALLLRFGHAHLVFVKPLPGVRWRRFGRMKILLFGANLWDLLAYAQAVCWWRPMNVYHGRGLRLRRQLVLRKAGKVSAYR